MPPMSLKCEVNLHIPFIRSKILTREQESAPVRGLKIAYVIKLPHQNPRTYRLLAILASCYF